MRTLAIELGAEGLGEGAPGRSADRSGAHHEARCASVELIYAGFTVCRSNGMTAADVTA